MNLIASSGSTIRIAAVAAAVGISLLLTACSGDGGEGGEVAGVDETTAAPDQDDGADREEGEEKGQGDGIDRPGIQVAETLEMIFEDVATDDPVEQAVLHDNEQQILAVYEVMTDHDAESAISFYTGEDAFLADMNLLETAFDRGQNPAGTMRYYARDVTLLTDDTAIVFYCRDFSEVETLEASSGEVVEDADPGAQPTYYEGLLRKNEDGVWVTVNREHEQRSSQC